MIHSIRWSFSCVIVTLRSDGFASLSILWLAVSILVFCSVIAVLIGVISITGVGLSLILLRSQKSARFSSYVIAGVNDTSHFVAVPKSLSFCSVVSPADSVSVRLGWLHISAGVAHPPDEPPVDTVIACTGWL